MSLSCPVDAELLVERVEKLVDPLISFICLLG